MKIDDTTHLLSHNQTYSSVNDPCKVYKCIGDAQLVKSVVECNSTCDIEQIYRIVPGECCGQCIPGICFDQSGRKFNVGETWKSPDNCTINECIDDGREIVITSYQKTCPKLQNCPTSNIEIRECCSYCNHRKDSESIGLVNY